MTFTFLIRQATHDELPPAAPLPATLQTLACRRWPLGYFECCRSYYGDRFTVRPIDMPPLVFLADPSDVRSVLTASESVFDTGAGGEVVVPLFGEESFMLRDGDAHMCGRNAVLPAFHRGAVQRLTTLVAALIAQEVGSWPLEQPFAVYPRLRALTLRVIVQALLGDDHSICLELQEQLLEMLAVMHGLLLQQPGLRHLPGWRGAWRQFIERRAKVRLLIESLIASHREEGNGDVDLLDLLVGARNPDGSPLSERQVRDNLLSVLIAGHETTASELAWAFQLLAHNPSVQGRLTEEIDLAGGEEPYLEATIQEVLRHRPVFPFASPRGVVESVEIGGWTYRAPAQLMPCIYLVHHDARLYSHPHEFTPERFLGGHPRPRIWLPWGGGRKRCLGQHLALLEMREVLRAILCERQILPASRQIERPRWRTVLLTPHAGSRVVLRRRTQPRRSRVEQELLRAAA